MNTITTEQAQTLGKLWDKNGLIRYYINNWTSLIGLEISLYNSGNISSASLNGERISNSAAYRLLAGKAWIENGEVRTKDVDDTTAEMVRNAIADKLIPATTAMTAREAAAKLGVSVRTVQRWAKLGKLDATKTDHRWSITL